MAIRSSIRSILLCIRNIVTQSFRSGMKQLGAIFNAPAVFLFVCALFTEYHLWYVANIIYISKINDKDNVDDDSTIAPSHHMLIFIHVWICVMCIRRSRHMYLYVRERGGVREQTKTTHCTIRYNLWCWLRCCRYCPATYMHTSICMNA